MTSVPFFLLLFAVAVSYAALRGGRPERWTAFAYLVALAGSASLGLMRIAGNFSVVPMQLFVVDALLLLALAILAIRANRIWLIPAAGCQLVAVLVHATKLIDPGMIPNGYAFLTTIWSWPMVLLLAYGTWRYRRREATGTAIPDWKASSAPRRSVMPRMRRSS